MTSDDAWREGVGSTERLAALIRSGLIESGPEDAFDRLTELAGAVTGATRACITLVDARHYTYKSTVGVAEGDPRVGDIETSFCRYVVGSSKPFVVDDARSDPRTLDDPAVEIHGVAAWAGYPIEDADGWVLGTFCLVAAEPYVWTDTDLHVLATLAQAASSEVALRRSEFMIEAARATAEELRLAANGERTATRAGSGADAGRGPPGRRVAALAQQLSDALRPAQQPDRTV